MNWTTGPMSLSSFGGGRAWRAWLRPWVCGRGTALSEGVWAFVAGAYSLFLVGEQVYLHRLRYPPPPWLSG